MPLVNVGMQWKVLDPDVPGYPVIPPDVWTTVRYNYELGNHPDSTWNDLAAGVFRPRKSYNPGRFLCQVVFRDPGPDVRVIATRMRLARNPDTPEQDITCTTEWAGTPGTVTCGGYAWAFLIRPSQPVGMQVLVQTELTEPVTVETSAGPRELRVPVPGAPAPALEIMGAEFKLTVWS